MEYGKAEALLERKWPEKYNRGGHLAWEGRMYASAPLRRRGGRIGYGTWGSNLFQSLYDRTPSTLGTLPLMPEWYLLIGLLAVLSIVGIFEQPLVPVDIGRSGANRAAPPRGRSSRPCRQSRTQRLARSDAAHRLTACGQRRHCGPVPAPASGASHGRMRGGLTPWRQRGELASLSVAPTAERLERALAVADRPAARAGA